MKGTMLLHTLLAAIRFLVTSMGTGNGGGHEMELAAAPATTLGTKLDLFRCGPQLLDHRDRMTHVQQEFAVVTQISEVVFNMVSCA
jgi:hypothetical protein